MSLPVCAWRFLPSLLLFSTTAGLGQVATSLVPYQSLLPEKAQAQGGAPVTVHTNFGAGPGSFLHNGEVVAARHAILTPEGYMASEVRVGFAQPPLNKVVQNASVPIAQDTVHDLVLLRLTEGTAPVQPSLPMMASAVTPPEPVPGATLDVRRERDTRIAQLKRPEFRLHFTQMYAGKVPQTTERRAVLSFGHGQDRMTAKVLVRVEWDRPLAKRR